MNTSEPILEPCTKLVSTLKDWGHIKKGTLLSSFQTLLTIEKSPVEIPKKIFETTYDIKDSFLFKETKLPQPETYGQSANISTLFGNPIIQTENELKRARIPILEGKIQYLMMQYMIFDKYLFTTVSTIQDSPIFQANEELKKINLYSQIGYDHYIHNFQIENEEKPNYIKNFSTIYTDALFSLNTIDGVSITRT